MLLATTRVVFSQGTITFVQGYKVLTPKTRTCNYRALFKVGRGVKKPGLGKKKKSVTFNTKCFPPKNKKQNTIACISALHGILSLNLEATTEALRRYPSSDIRERQVAQSSPVIFGMKTKNTASLYHQSTANKREKLSVDSSPQWVPRREIRGSLERLQVP